MEGSEGSSMRLRLRSSLEGEAEGDMVDGSGVVAVVSAILAPRVDLRSGEVMLVELGETAA